MDLISYNPAFKRRLIIIWSSILLILHTAFTLLSIYDAYISGDIMKKSMDTALSFILPIAALLLVYIRFGVLLSVYHTYERGTLIFTIIAVISLVLTRVSEHILYVYTYSHATVNTSSYLFSIFSSFMIDLATVLILLLFSRSKKERERKIFPLLIIACVIPLAVTLFDESVFLIKFLQEIKAEYGSTALTSAEIRSIVWVFVRPVINAVIGFVIMVTTYTILKRASREYN